MFAQIGVDKKEGEVVEGEADSIGLTPVLQILLTDPKTHSMDETKRAQLLTKIEKNCGRFMNKSEFSPRSISVNELYNVLKIQNGIQCNKSDLRKLAGELGMDDEGRILMKDFFHKPIITETVFRQYDKNKDGFLSKGELRLAKKNMSMQRISGLFSHLDSDGDGKLGYEEFFKARRRKWKY